MWSAKRGEWSVSVRWQNWLLGAALADWLIGRTLSRAAIFAPKTGIMLPVSQAMMTAGQVAFNLSAILTLSVIVWLAVRGLRHAERNLPLSAALAGLVGLSVAGVFTPPGSASLLAFHAFTLVTLALLVVQGLRAQPEPRARLALALPALAITCIATFKIAQTLTQWSGSSAPASLALASFQVGELFVVLSPLAVWWAYGRTGRGRDWVIAGILAALFTTATLANPSMTATMATWSVGLSLYLPWPVYAISLWLAAVTILRALRAGQGAGYGLAYLAAAGYAMQLSSQVMLGLVGIWMLLLPNLIPLASLRGLYSPTSNLQPLTSPELKRTPDRKYNRRVVQ
jgi:hypothetical protein